MAAGPPSWRDWDGARSVRRAFLSASGYEAFRMLFNCINIFSNLPIRSLNKLSLQRRLEEIGQNLPDTA
ncbi:MAG: hypothetical protein Kow00114_23570 [Kiloniellaceae bacterium]